MSSKMFFWALVALTLSMETVSGDVSLPDLVSAAINQSQALAARSQEAARAAAAQLQAGAAQLLASAEQLLGSNRGPLQEIADKVLAEVEKAAGNLPACAAGQAGNVSSLVSSTELGLLRCVTDRVVEVGLLVVDVAQQAGRAIQLPQQAAANVSLCLGNLFTALPCVAQVVTASEQAANAIVSALVADGLRGQQLVIAGPAEIAQCAAVQMDAAAAGANRIVVDIAQCVVDGANSTTPSG